MLQLSLVFSGIDRVDDSEDESEYLTALLARLGQAATLAQYQGHHRVQLEQDIREAIDEFDRAYFQPSKQRRLNSDVDPSEHKDILSLLLEHQSTLALTDAAMLREVGFFYLASAHTSVHSITHGFHELFTYLESTGLTVNNLLEDPLLLQRCAHESLRLHPSSPEAWRRAVRHLELPDGRSLAEGDEVIIDLQTANRDETVFGIDAEVFNPNRPRTIGANPWGLSFGSGMHVCIGLNLVAGAVVNRSNPPDLQTHQWGSLTTIYRLLLAAGLRPDQDQPPEKDLESARDTWLHYPVCLP
jgi:cytochrome P450